MKTLLASLAAIALLTSSAIAQQHQHENGQHQHPAGQNQESSLTEAEAQAYSDQLHIAAQGICPVSGQKLGSMGAPIKVQVGEEHAFLCCKGCQGKQISAEHWGTVQTNLAKAQGICPVMGKPVNANMKSTVVNGRKIFVCCPPCIKKINADPTAFVAKLDAQIAANTHAGEHQQGEHHQGDGHDPSAHNHIH